MFKKVWHDPVGSKVIATAICSIPGLVILFHVSGWFPIGGKWVLSESTAPNWLLLLLWVALLWKACDTVHVLYKWRKATKAERENTEIWKDVLSRQLPSTPPQQKIHTVKGPSYFTHRKWLKDQ